MKRTLILALSALLLGSFAAVPASAKPKKLPAGEAVLDARIKMADFAINDDDLGYPAHVRCQRKSRIRFRCTGVATGEAERYTKRCDFVSIVVNKRRRLNYSSYWEAVATLPVKKCSTTPKPWLEEADARAAILQAGQKETGTTVIIDSLFQSTDTSWDGSVIWHAGQPGVGFDCGANVEAERRVDQSIKVTFSDEYCN